MKTTDLFSNIDYGKKLQLADLFYFTNHGELTSFARLCNVLDYSKLETNKFLFYRYSGKLPISLLFDDMERRQPNLTIGEFQEHMLKIQRDDICQFIADNIIKD